MLLKMLNYPPPPEPPLTEVTASSRSDRSSNRHLKISQRQAQTNFTIAQAPAADPLPAMKMIPSTPAHFTSLEEDWQFGERSIPTDSASNEALAESSPRRQAVSVSTAIRANVTRLGPPLSVGQKLSPTASPQERTIRLTAQERGGSSLEFSIPLDQAPDPNLPPVEAADVVEVDADQQEYDQQQQVITAQGNVQLRFSRAVLTADRLQVNLPNRLAVAQGNVVLKRGDQVLRGERFEYFFAQDNGTIFNANGEIYVPTLSRDTVPVSPTATGIIPAQPLSDRLAANQPLQRITTAEGYEFRVGSIQSLTLLGEGEFGLPSLEGGGQINRLRFQAERVDFEADTWQATNVRITNDPFSPPELEVRADTATFRNVAPLVDELTTTNSRVVFDQGFSLPIFQDRLVFDRRPRQPGIVQFRFDGEERGGLFIERSFSLVNTEKVSLSVTPQYLIQRSLFPGILNEEDEGSVIGPSAFGLTTDLNVNFSPRTTLQGEGSLTSLDLGELSDELRVKLSLQNQFGDLTRPYTVSLDYNYRERLFNGSLGFQRVQSSIGAIITSPTIALGQTGVNLNYQASVQNINAETDQRDLLEAGDDEEVVNLTRYQAAASVEKNFLLWQGQALPPTAEAGLRFTPAPVLPFLQLTTGLTGVASYYSNGDTQPSLRGTVGLQGQIGHFSRPYLDYTGFNISYSQGIRGDESPFKFDRFVDQSTVSFGITQQIYGPFRFGFQSSFSLDENEDISTDYFLEYSRRTYNVVLRYNPVLEIGSINLRISDFNWVGDPEPFDGSGIQPVEQGVTR